MIVRLGQVAPRYNFADLFWWTYLLGLNVGQSVVTSWIFKFRHLMNIHGNGVAKLGEAVIRTFGHIGKKNRQRYDIWRCLCCLGLKGKKVYWHLLVIDFTEIVILEAVDELNSNSHRAVRSLCLNCERGLRIHFLSKTTDGTWVLEFPCRPSL